MSHWTTAPDEELDAEQEALFAAMIDFLRQIDTPYNVLFETLSLARDEGRTGPELRRRLRRELGALVYDIKLLARRL